MSDQLDIGDKVRLRGVFTDPNDSDAKKDPTAIHLRYRDPSGNLTERTFGVDAELVKEATGIYYEDVTLDESGIWSWKMLGTGAVVAAEETSFEVKEERVPSP